MGPPAGDPCTGPCRGRPLENLTFLCIKLKPPSLDADNIRNTSRCLRSLGGWRAPLPSPLSPEVDHNYLLCTCAKVGCQSCTLKFEPQGHIRVGVARDGLAKLNHGLLGKLMLRQVGPTWQRCCSSSASWIHTATLTIDVICAEKATGLKTSICLQRTTLKPIVAADSIFSLLHWGAKQCRSEIVF
jgi:hypothetical protein